MVELGEAYLIHKRKEKVQIKLITGERFQGTVEFPLGERIIEFTDRHGKQFYIPLSSIAYIYVENIDRGREHGGK